MFTGLVTHVGTVRSLEGHAERRFVIEPGMEVADVPIGASVCHDGVCLSIVEKAAVSWLVHASPETLARTTLGTWEKGRRINLERSLRLGDELGGHLVFGHVDCTAEITAIEPAADSHRFVFGIPPELAGLIAVKGSIAVDGVSLTVTEIVADRFAVMVIPHSFGVTTLRDRAPGDLVNLEVDMLARYVARHLAVPR